MCKDFGGKTIAHFIRKGYHFIQQQYIVPEEECPPLLTPEMYLQIYLENQKKSHRWKSIAKRFSESQQIDNIIVKNKALEIQRKIKDFKMHQSIIKQIPFEQNKIIEYLNESEGVKLYH